MHIIPPNPKQKSWPRRIFFKYTGDYKIIMEESPMHKMLVFQHATDQFWIACQIGIIFLHFRPLLPSRACKRASSITKADQSEPHPRSVDVVSVLFLWNWAETLKLFQQGHFTVISYPHSSDVFFYPDIRLKPSPCTRWRKSFYEPVHLFSLHFSIFLN